MENDPRKNIWIGFDMDETLAHLNNLFFPMLAIHDSIVGEKIANEIARRVAVAVPLGVDVGFLRPGIYKLFNFFNELHRRNVDVNIRIYSNSSWPFFPEFLKKVFLIWYPSAVCEYVIDQSHARNPDDIGPKNGKRKTWNTFKRIFSDGEEPTPADSYFIDDLEHTNLKEILQGNYIQCVAYRTDPPDYSQFFKIIWSVFMENNVLKMGDIFDEQYITNIIRHTNVRDDEKRIIYEDPIWNTFLTLSSQDPQPVPDYKYSSEIDGWMRKIHDNIYLPRGGTRRRKLDKKKTRRHRR
jgi:hypothetical protein